LFGEGRGGSGIHILTFAPPHWQYAWKNYEHHKRDGSNGVVMHQTQHTGAAANQNV